MSVPCPGLAEAIQGEQPVSEHTLTLVQRACEPLREAAVDTVILGCTHYPLVAKMLQRDSVRTSSLVAAADELAREVAETLRRKGWGNEASRRGEYAFLSTGEIPTSSRAWQRASCITRCGPSRLCGSPRSA